MNPFRPPALRISAVLFGAVLSVAPSLFAPSLLAQSSASLYGRATDESGRPAANAVVRLVSDQTSYSGRTWRYTLMADSLGKFSQEGLAPGAYLVMLFTGGRGSTVLLNVTLRAGEAREITLGMNSGLPPQVAGNEATPMGGSSWTGMSTR